jgi:hypothetical protein
MDRTRAILVLNDIVREMMITHKLINAFDWPSGKPPINFDEATWENWIKKMENYDEDKTGIQQALSELLPERQKTLIGKKEIPNSRIREVFQIMPSVPSEAPRNMNQTEARRVLNDLLRPMMIEKNVIEPNQWLTPSEEKRWMDTLQQNPYSAEGIKKSMRQLLPKAGSTTIGGQPIANSKILLASAAATPDEIRKAEDQRIAYIKKMAPRVPTYEPVGTGVEPRTPTQPTRVQKELEKRRAAFEKQKQRKLERQQQLQKKVAQVNKATEDARRTKELLEKQQKESRRLGFRPKAKRRSPSACKKTGSTKRGKIK